jgi:hypothetical protein
MDCAQRALMVCSKTPVFDRGAYGLTLAMRDGTEATSRHPSKRTRRPAHPAYPRLLQHAVQIPPERVMQLGLEDE